MRRDEARRAGLTLIESLVVVGVIGLLVGLLLPAAQSAREAARRLACAGNLRQIALASHAYHDANGCLPPGRFKSYDRRHAGASPPCTVPFVDKSVHVHLLPFVEQAAIYDAINHDLSVVGPENATLHNVGLPLFACPSDPEAGRARPLPAGGLAAFGVPDPPDGRHRMVFTSYQGSAGSRLAVALPTTANRCTVAPEARTQNDGVFHDLAPIRLADVRDGTGTTLFFSERSVTTLGRLGRFNPELATRYGWFAVGDWGDTLFSTMYPIQAPRRVAPGAIGAWAGGASSHHPGGVMAATGDGAVRFVRDGIASWPFDPATGHPAGATRTEAGWWAGLPTPSVWQALATRAGGEVVGDAW